MQKLCVQGLVKVWLCYGSYKQDWTLYWAKLWAVIHWVGVFHLDQWVISPQRTQTEWRGMLDKAHFFVVWEWRKTKTHSPRLTFDPPLTPAGHPVVLEPTFLPLSELPQGDSFSERAPCVHCHAKSAQGWCFHKGPYQADGRPDLNREPTSDKFWWPAPNLTQPLTLLFSYTSPLSNKQSCGSTYMWMQGYSYVNHFQVIAKVQTGEKLMDKSNIKCLISTVLVHYMFTEQLHCFLSWRWRLEVGFTELRSGVCEGHCINR